MDVKTEAIADPTLTVNPDFTEVGNPVPAMIKLNKLKLFILI